MPIFQRHTKQELESKEQEYWHHIQRLGRAKFIWRTGIVGWGLTYVAFWTPLFCLFTHRLTVFDFLLTASVALPISAFFGYVNAARRWKQMLAKYDS
jgi:hypothetical protein